VPAEIVERFPASIAGYTPGRLELPEMPADALEHSRRAERQELDPMAHVNNAAYIDQFEAALEEIGAAGLATAFPRRYQIEYLAPAPSGAILRWRVWPTEGGAAGRVRDEAGIEVARILAEAG
jgi:acyl-ACP thioesterase